MEELGFRPLGARVLVEKYKEEKKEDYVSIGGLYIPPADDVNLEFKKSSGKILAIGTGLSADGEENLGVGTTISFSNPHQIKYKGTDYYLVHENNIELIIIEEE